MKHRHSEIRIGSIVAAIGIVSVLLGWSPLAFPQEKSGIAPTAVPAEKPLLKCSLRLKWLLVSGFAGELAAKENGYFAQEGLDVSIFPGGLENKPERLVAAGSDLFGITGADGIFLARAKGVPLVAFAAQYARNASAFFSLKDSGIKSPADFAGKRIGVKYGLEMDPIYRALIKKCGIPTAGITEIPVSYSLAPLLDKQVDVFPAYMNTIFPAVTEKGIEVNVIDPLQYGVPFHGNVYFCSEETLLKQPQVVGAFARAVIRGWQWAAEHPDQVGALVKKYNPQADAASETTAFKVILPYLLPSNGRMGWMDREVIAETGKILEIGGMLDKKVDLDPGFTWAILNKIYPQ